MSVADALSPKRGWRVAVGAARLWPWGLAAAALVYAGWSYDWRAVWPVLARIPVLTFVASGTALILVLFLALALRWISVAGLPLRDGRFLQVYIYTTVAVAIGQNTPMQIGEALKVRFARRSGLSPGHSAFSLVIERIVDLIVVGDLAVIGLVRRQTGSLEWLSAAAIVPLGALFCLLVNLWRLDSLLSRWTRTARLGDAASSLTAFRVGALLALTGLKWLVVAVLWQWTLSFAGCGLGLTDAMLTVSTVSVVSVLSMVPGGLGVQDLSLKTMLVTLGIAPDAAEAGSITVRLLTPMMILIGLLHLPAFIAGGSPAPAEDDDAP